MASLSKTLGSYPTRVERLSALGRSGTALWVKRDDLTHPVYGGNKVRKLERILARAKEHGATRIVTIGAAGSHHVLATAIFAAEMGIAVDAVLVPQPRTPHVADNLRASLAQGLRAFPVRSYAGVPWAVLRRLGPGATFVPVGGSSLTGAMGYVDGARELAAQIRAGDLPEPDAVVVTLGSGGTAAGIVAGLALEGLATRVIAVSVSTPAVVVAWTTRLLARRCARRAGGRIGWGDVMRRLIVDARYLGAGYGHATAEGDRAREVARTVGLTLDATYTAKTFAAALDLVASERYRNVLYWHTLSSAPMEPLLARAASEASLPAPLRALLR